MKLGTSNMVHKHSKILAIDKYLLKGNVWIMRSFKFYNKIANIINIKKLFSKKHRIRVIIILQGYSILEHTV